ncbi:hypothetical protein BDF21DRAFT_430108 [Thamnidium elegans]|nr:hypothetical protein BDF21DRAFT_430108 [Thamnidium elegans]
MQVYLPALLLVQIVALERSPFFYGGAILGVIAVALITLVHFDKNPPNYTPRRHTTQEGHSSPKLGAVYLSPSEQVTISINTLPFVPPTQVIWQSLQQELCCFTIRWK